MPAPGKPIDAVRVTRDIVATMDLLHALNAFGKPLPLERIPFLFERFRPIMDPETAAAIDTYIELVAEPWPYTPEVDARLELAYDHVVLNHRLAIAHAAASADPPRPSADDLF